MILTEQHIIKRNDERFLILDDLMFKSKNLYNCALYEVRQHFFLSQNDSSVKYKYLNYYETVKKMKENEWFNSLQSQCAQQTLMILDQNFKSFFALLKKKQKNEYTEKVRIPKYLSKDGRFQLKFPVNSLSKMFLDDGIIKVPKTNLKFFSKITNLKNSICEVRFIPKNDYIVMEIVYEVDDVKLKEDNKRYMSIDLGVNNLATCTSNVIPSFIINGRPLKSMNQFYNKKLAKLKSELQIKNKLNSSKQTRNLTLKRNNKVKDYLHKASKYIINQAVSSSLNTIIIGQNKGWKQEINIGKRNNQNFVQLPIAQLIDKIAYKAKLKGINVLIQEESYTSKASFIDNDELPIYSKKNDVTFSGDRIKRGLYKSKEGILLNADVNGSLNIMRKSLKESSDDLISPTCRGLVFNPIKVNL